MEIKDHKIGKISLNRGINFLTAASLSGMVFLISGCATVGPDFVKPEAPVAESWSDIEGEGLTKGDADYSTWWEIFNDPVLNKIVEKTYQQNLSLKVAGLRILEARAQLGIATGNLYPQQQLAAGKFASNRVSESMGTAVIDNPYNSVGVGFDAVWEIDFWGKFRRSVESGVANLEASIAGYDSILVSITAEAARTYIQIRTLEQRLEIAGENVNIQQRSLQIAEARFNGGEVSRLDVTQARSLLRNTQALIPSLQAALRQAKNALAILLGILPQELEALLDGPNTIPSISSEVTLALPAELLRRRPDIRLSELRVATQSAQIGVAKADLYPHFTLFGSIGWQATDASLPGGSNSLGDIFLSKSLFWKVGPAFSWDIFNYGRIKNKVRVEDAVFQQTVVNYRNTVLKAQQEVEDSIVAFRYTREKEKLLSESVDSAKESVALSQIQYGEGIVDFQRVLDTQRFLSSQADRYSETRGRVRTSLVALYKALGGGWQIRVGNDIIDAETRQEMNARTDWGGLLETDEITKSELPGEGGAPNLWRSPDW